MQDHSNCRLADGFTLWEKTYAQFSFLAMGAVGTVGIWLVDWRWAVLYLLMYA